MLQPNGRYTAQELTSPLPLALEMSMLAHICQFEDMETRKYIKYRVMVQSDFT